MRLILLLLLIPSLLTGQSRTVLGLFNSDQNPNYEERFNPIAEIAEMPLGWLGLRVRYHDIAKGVPSEQTMEGVFAILSWFDSSAMNDPAGYIDWAIGQIEAGRRLVMFGYPGFFSSMSGEPTPIETCNRLLHRLGLDYRGGWTDDPSSISISSINEQMMNFEHRVVAHEVPSLFEITPYGDDLEIDLSFSSELTLVEPIVGVGRSPSGAFAAPHCQLFSDPDTEGQRWLLDPFLFFEKALGISTTPRFDPTTLFGRRIAICHVDGDGVRNLSEIIDRRGESAGHVILEELFRKYWMPVTASLISCEFDPRYLGDVDTASLAREIFSLDWIECASHTFSHPLVWSEGITTFTIPGYSKTANPYKHREVLSRFPYTDVAIIEVPEREWLEREVVGSTRFFDEGAVPEGKRIEVIHWSGDCRPQAEAIALSDKQKTYNINGRTSRFDRAFPSYTYVAPYLRETGGHIQVHAINANDADYTNNWSGPYYGQRYVIETFQQTEYPTLIDGPPRRVAGMDLYYHFYSGEKLASLNALRGALDYMLAQPCIPLWASHYCAAVTGWAGAQMEQIEGGWRFSNYGACRTVRFDGESRFPDFDRSSGIVGFVSWEEALYIALAEGESTLIWANSPPSHPYLIEASARVDAAQIARDQTRFATRLFGPSLFRFANMTPGATYRIVAGDQMVEVEATEVGELEFTLQRGGAQEVEARRL